MLSAALCESVKAPRLYIVYEPDSNGGLEMMKIEWKCREIMGTRNENIFVS